jgi:hypothetical protein
MAMASPTSPDEGIRGWRAARDTSSGCALVHVIVAVANMLSHCSSHRHCTLCTVPAFKNTTQRWGQHSVNAYRAQVNDACVCKPLCCSCRADSLDARHAGVGVAIFNAVGAAIGGFVGPLVIGAFVQRMGTFVSAMVAMGAFLCFAGLMMVGLNIATRLVQRRRKVLQPARRAPSGSAIADSRTELLGPRTVGGPTDVRAPRDVELATLPNPRAHSVFKM